MNPVGLDPVNGIGWKFLIIYSVWILIEGILIYFLWPETSGRTLEELAFRKLSRRNINHMIADLSPVVFEDDDRVLKTAKAVENEIHQDSSVSDEKVAEKEVV